MTYSLVSAGTVASTAASATLSPTCTSTTAHNLLVLCFGAQAFTGMTVTLPAGWIQAATALSGTITRSDVWYYPDCPAGITSVLVTLSGGTDFSAQIMQFHDSAGTNTSPVDVTGSINNDTATPVPVATSGSALAGDLAVTAFTGFYVSATKDTVTPGAGFTQAGNYGNAVKQGVHAGFDYNVNTGAGAQTDSVAFTGPFSAAAGAIATFQVAPLVMTNTAEGGTSGTAASAGNSGGTSGTAFGGVNIGSGCTYAFDNTRAKAGTLSYKIGSTATSTFFYATWGSFTATTTAWVRAYLYFTANPPVFTPVRFVGASGTALRGAIVFASGGKLAAMNSGGSTVATMTNAVALNQWIRVEAFLTGSATVGQIEIKLFNTTESLTPTETLTTTAVQNTGGTVTDIWWGESGGAANCGPYWMDDIGVSGTAYLGPTGVLATVVPDVIMAPMTGALWPGSPSRSGPPARGRRRCRWVPSGPPPRSAPGSWRWPCSTPRRSRSRSRWPGSPPGPGRKAPRSPPCTRTTTPRARSPRRRTRTPSPRPRSAPRSGRPPSAVPPGPGSSGRSAAGRHPASSSRTPPPTGWASSSRPAPGRSATSPSPGMS